MAHGAFEPRFCPRGHRLSDDETRCSQCWLGVGLMLPSRIGPYAIVEQLGQGAHGTVYLARQPGAGMEVALKVISGGQPEREITSHVRFEHPNVVRVFDASGLLEDPPYFAMQYVRGGTLDHDRWRKVFRAPEKAIELLIAIAEGVQYAHERMLLHRDLKPNNILIDEQGRPHVSDFSVAKPLDGAEPALTRTAAGCYPYMSAEQAGAIAAPVTTASDVYGLGAILYELLTDRRARDACSLAELRASFEQSPEPEPLRLPWRWRELEAVCLRALRKDPDARYRSAAAFAEDLRCVRDGGVPRWRPAAPFASLGRWALHRPRLALAIGLGALLLAAMNAQLFASIRDQQAMLRDHVLRGNAALAKAQAQAALAELAKLAQATLAIAEGSEPQLEQVLRAPRRPPAGPEPVLDPAGPELNVVAHGFDSVFVLDCAGMTRAHSFDDDIRKRFPLGPPGYFGTSYDFRDYFQGAVELAKHDSRAVYISRSFRSTWDRRFKFGFSTPIYPAHPTGPGCWGTHAIGVLMAAMSASSTLGDVQIPEIAGSGQRTALFGPRDHDRADAPLPRASDLYVLVHEQLHLGDERQLDPKLAERLSRQFHVAASLGAQFEPTAAQPLMDEHYRDPVDASDQRWLAGFFPVGRTGFVVGVTTPYGKTSQLVHGSEALVAMNLGFVLYCLAAFWFASRKSRASRTSGLA